MLFLLIMLYVVNCVVLLLIVLFLLIMLYVVNCVVVANCVVCC